MAWRMSFCLFVCVWERDNLTLNRCLSHLQSNYDPCPSNCSYSFRLLLFHMSHWEDVSAGTRPDVFYWAMVVVEAATKLVANPYHRYSLRDNCPKVIRHVGGFLWISLNVAGTWIVTNIYIYMVQNGSFIIAFCFTTLFEFQWLLDD